MSPPWRRGVIPPPTRSEEWKIALVFALVLYILVCLISEARRARSRGRERGRLPSCTCSCNTLRLLLFLPPLAMFLFHLFSHLSLFMHCVALSVEQIRPQACTSFVLFCSVLFSFFSSQLFSHVAYVRLGVLFFSYSVGVERDHQSCPFGRAFVLVYHCCFFCCASVLHMKVVSCFRRPRLRLGEPSLILFAAESSHDRGQGLGFLPRVLFAGSRADVLFSAARSSGQQVGCSLQIFEDVSRPCFGELC